MNATARTVRRSGTKGTETTASHAVRTPNELWARAKARAARDGLAINRVIIELLEGYTRGIYRLPKRRTVEEREYGAQPEDATASTLPV